MVDQIDEKIKVGSAYWAWISTNQKDCGMIESDLSRAEPFDDKGKKSTWAES
jgi:hypothetical protein